MVAGIIVTAVGDELIISYPTELTSTAITAAVLGGPALFLAGHALFKWAVFNRLPTSRLVAILVLVALAPVSQFVPPLILAAGATLVVAAVAVFDTWSAHHTMQPHIPTQPKKERA